MRNRQEIERSALCGCFCCRTFSPSEIEVWIDKGETAMCPYCDVDAVIGDASEVELSASNLKALNNRYF